MSRSVTKLVEVPIKSVILGDRKRRVTKPSIDKMVDAIRLIGLQTPITVKPKDANGKYKLVVGATRLAAYAVLKRPTIPARVWDCSEAQAEVWEIIENMARTELTLSQRDAGLVRILELKKELVPDARAAEEEAARETGSSYSDIRDAQARQNLRDDPDVLTLAKQLGLENVKAAMNEAAQAATKEEALDVLRRYHRAREGKRQAKERAEKQQRWHEWRNEIRNLWQAAPDDASREWFLTDVAGVDPKSKAPTKRKAA